MWVELGRSLGVELEYLFAVIAEAAMPDQLLQPAEISHSSQAEPTPPSHSIN
ncbi:MAG: hypothetical protein RL497_1650 [Pseudomonadota bacterium]